MSDQFSFNLIDEMWIPCIRTNDGQTVILSCLLYTSAHLAQDTIVHANLLIRASLSTKLLYHWLSRISDP